MTQVFKIDPFKGLALIPTIYFVISIFTMIKVYYIVNDKIGKNFFVTYKTVHIVPYIFGPIILIYKKLNKK